MNIIIKTIIIIYLSIMLISCSTDISHYKSESPTFNIKTYFDGKLIGWGMLQDYTNEVTRRFCVEIDANWIKEKGTLEETFYFDDGEVSYRTWNLIKLKDSRYTGSAQDVVGIASGVQSGFAFQWKYKLAVPVDGSTYHFDMDDWMYKMDDSRVFNKTSMSKFGVKVAEITLFFDKQLSEQKCAEQF